MISRMGILIGLAFFSSNATAQRFPYGMPDTPGCIQPKHMNQSGQLRQAAQASWIDTWGAIPLDRDLGKLGLLSVKRFE